MSDNPFDQFDDEKPAATADNPFDQFDEPTTSLAGVERPKVSKYADAVDAATAKPAIGDSIGNQLHAMGSSMVHGAVAGYKGVADLATGKGLDAAADTVNAEQAKAYQAPDSGVKSVMESKYNPLNYAQEAADWGADKSADMGASPAVSTAIKAAPTALMAATGLTGLARKPGLAIGRGYPEKPAAPVEPTVAAPPAPQSPESVVAKATAGQSMGAASAPIDISGVSKELRDKVASTDPDQLNLEALARQQRAETLPLPDGMTPMRLRKGQALRDDQQISDEKNFRGDPDTQGALSDSITDQDQKSIASMGEIRQRATPDIVQRDNVEHGQAAVDAIKNQDNQSVLDIRAKYKALADANGGDMPLDASAAVNEITPILKKKSLRNTVAAHPVLSEIMDNLRSGEPVDFETFEDWRTRLAEVQRGSDGAARTAAGIMHNTLNSMPLEEGAQGLRDLADTARQAASARFNIIKRNPAYKAVINDNVDKLPNGLHEVGAESPLASGFMNRFALGDGPTASGAFISRLKDAVPNPELHQSIEAAGLNKLRDAAGINGLGEAKSFNHPSYQKAVKGLAPKNDALFSPQTAENIQHLDDVSRDINYEGPASLTSRSNTPLVMQRFGAIQSEAPAAESVGSGLIRSAVGHGVRAIPYVGKPIHAVGDAIINHRSNLEAAKTAEKIKQSIKDAKLKFAQDATAPGAGIDWQPPPPPVARATGGKAGPSDEELVARLMSRWKKAKRESDASTKPLLGVPDESIIHALRVSGAAL